MKKRCKTCGIVKNIAKNRINCNDCLKKRREERWKKYKEEVISNPQDRLYLIALPVNGKYTGSSFVNAMVYPYEIYGGISGLELIKLYLSKHDEVGKPPDTPTKKMYKYRHKQRWGGEAKSVYELEILTELGNKLNDKSFNEFKTTLSDIEDVKDRKAYINSFKALPDDKFYGSNEATGIRYKSEAEKVEWEYLTSIKKDNTPFDDIDGKEEEEEE